MKLYVFGIAGLILAGGQIEASAIISAQTRTVGTYGTGPTDGRAFGFDFLVGTSNIQLNALGASDVDGDGLPGTVEIRVWNRSSQTLVAQASISGTAGYVDDNWRYVNIAPVVLLANMRYSFVSDAIQVMDAYQTTAWTGMNSSLGAWVPAAAAGQTRATSSINVFPTQDYSNSGARSFAAQVNADVSEFVAPVPEPASIAMWGLASGLGLVIARRRKRMMIA